MRLQPACRLSCFSCCCVRQRLCHRLCRCSSCRLCRRLRCRLCLPFVPPFVPLLVLPFVPPFVLPFVLVDSRGLAVSASSSAQLASIFPSRGCRRIEIFFAGPAAEQGARASSSAQLASTFLSRGCQHIDVFFPREQARRCRTTAAVARLAADSFGCAHGHHTSILQGFFVSITHHARCTASHITHARCIRPPTCTMMMLLTGNYSRHRSS